jgi:AcrR family transcriptional regulator
MTDQSLDTRSRILNATWHLLESNRGRLVRMSDIAKSAHISRQAIYLHFKSRSELFIATTRYVEEVKGTDDRLEASRQATTGIDRLNAFVQGWGSFIPEVYGVAKTLMILMDTDEAAARAWDNRMTAFREGCEAAIKALAADKDLSADFTKKRATDMLFTMLSVGNWEHLTLGCGWSQKDYLKFMKLETQAVLVAS